MEKKHSLQFKQSVILNMGENHLSYSEAVRKHDLRNAKTEKPNIKTTKLLKLILRTKQDAQKTAQVKNYCIFPLNKIYCIKGMMFSLCA